MRRDVLQHHNEAGLRTRLVHRVGHAVVEGIEVFAHGHRQHELLANQVEHVLFALGIGNVGVQKVLPHGLRRFLQVLHPESPDRLHDIGANTPQNRFGYGLELWLGNGLTR